MNHRPLVFLDIETTGAAPHNSRVLEIGALRVENGKTIASYSQLLSPETPIPPFITNLTGITGAMTANSPIFGSIANELEEFLRGAIFVAHNVAFDYNFIKAEFKKIDRTFNMDRLCTVRLSRALYPTQQRHNLDTLIATHGFMVSSRHRALDDAQVLVDFFHKSLNTHGLAVYAAMDKLTKYART